MGIIMNLRSSLGSEADYVKAGGKGRGLWQLLRLNLPCPETWVISTDFFNNFTADLPANLSEVDLQAEAEGFAAQFTADVQLLPDGLYAVRSSALVEDSVEHSFAGMFESKLNISRMDIPRAAAQVWLSGLGKRVQQYSESGQWPEMAVLIQPMVTARFSGVCFSQHPSPGTIKQNGSYLIELVAGCGEQLVQGEVTPVRLTGTYQYLAACTDYPWLPQLLDAVMQLENETSGPVDVEFAVDADEKLWLLQQRPVTGITPSFSINMSGFKKVYKRALCSLDIEFLIDGCAKYLAPYLEVPVDLSDWMVLLTNEKDGQQELWINQHSDTAVIRNLAQMFKSDRSFMDRLKARYEHYHHRILNWKCTAWADQNLSLKYRLHDLFEFIVPINAHYYAPMLIIESLSLNVLEVMRSIDQENADDDFFTLTTSGISTLGNDFAEELCALRRSIAKDMGHLPDTLSELPEERLIQVEALVEKYGFLNCHQPYEEPYTSKYVYEMLKSPDSSEPNQDKECSAQDMAECSVLILGKYNTNSDWNDMYSSLVYWLKVRNRQMEYLYFAYAKAAPLLTLVGEKLGISLEEVWNCEREWLLTGLSNPAEFQQPQKADNLTLIHNGRKAVVSSQLKIIHPDAENSSGGLKGRTVFGTGELVGKVKVAFTPEELAAVGSLEDIILVTGMTTPDFVPLLKKAAALVTDEGGILCHAAIIAREIRLPCLVGTGIATEKLRDGMEIKLDLSRGEIKLI